MQISSRFTMAIHMFACIDTFSDQKMTSDFMAASIGTNPVIVRKILQQLKAAGLIEVARGTGGVTITRPLEQITFLDVYKAVECAPDEFLPFIKTKLDVVLFNALPFNILKGLVIGAIAMMIYKKLTPILKGETLK